MGSESPGLHPPSPRAALIELRDAEALIHRLNQTNQDLLLRVQTPTYSLDDARAHVSAYFAAKGVVEVCQLILWTPESAPQANFMLVSSLKAMSLALERLQRIKTLVGENTWFEWCAINHPLHVLDSGEIQAAAIAAGIRKASARVGLGSAFAESFITDIRMRLE